MPKFWSNWVTSQFVNYLHMFLITKLITTSDHYVSNWITSVVGYIFQKIGYWSKLGIKNLVFTIISHKTCPQIFTNKIHKLVSMILFVSLTHNNLCITLHKTH